ncbi:MAG: hypothetical protein AAF543_18045, partial [Pseudomonadota bacterium]
DQVHFDLVKLPHHGSDRNVDDDFFEKVIADHYVISGDGRHHNPEIDTFKMLFKARKEDGKSYTLHLTYPPEDLRRYPTDELEKLFDEAADDGARFRLRYPEDGASSMTIPLA